MAVIKTLLLQVFFLLALIGALQAAVYKATIAATPTTPNCAASLSLECTDSQMDGTEAIKFVQFFKGTKNITGWETIGSGKTHVVAATHLDVTHKGDYTCKGAKDTAGADVGKPSAVINVPCTGCGTVTADACTDTKFKCEKKGQAATRTCQCKFGAKPTKTFDVKKPDDCRECKDNHVELCESGKKSCNAAGECVAPPTIPPTGSGTKPTTGAPVTSSAGTVTSTACLVIASVVVALMN